ncbi:MAG TPA: mersacidin/lichenicidin family type 2 lantibiotic [Ktedonobacteraceae bacterium]|nr:mersacidin/lichenicidin family type 2 lantibiotic [Ktedonobacteraceae bacterium]
MKLDVVRAWKDDVYRQSLSDEQADMLPSNPAGELELTSDDLQSVYGGGGGFPPPAAPAGIARPISSAHPGPVPVGPVGPIGGGPGAASSEAGAISGESFLSIAVFCQQEMFSWNINSGLNFLAATNNICVNVN